jgi:hypothetical protein
MNTKPQSKLLKDVRSIADELTTCGSREPLERDTQNRISQLMGGTSTLVSWINSLDPSPLKTALKKLCGHLVKVYQSSDADFTAEDQARIIDAAALQLPAICDQIERLTTVPTKEASGGRKPRHDWEGLKAKAIARMSKDKGEDCLGWSGNHWARFLGVPTSTFAESDLAEWLAALAEAQRIRNKSDESDD